MKMPVPVMLKGEIVRQEPLVDKSTFAALCTPQNVISEETHACQGCD